jgi:hypothetical protein
MYPAHASRVAGLAGGVRTCVRVDQGLELREFQESPPHRNITIIRAAAAELPRIGLADALAICLALRGAEPAIYDRAVVRWLGRFALERPGVTLAELRCAMAAFERLPADPDGARRELEGLAWR